MTYNPEEVHCDFVYILISQRTEAASILKVLGRNTEDNLDSLKEYIEVLDRLIQLADTVQSDRMDREYILEWHALNHKAAGLMASHGPSWWS